MPARDGDSLRSSGVRAEIVRVRFGQLCGIRKLVFRGFPDFGIWSKSDEAPFVCLEPWYGSADNLGFEGELPDKYGILSLEAGKEFSTEYRILIHA